jgi:AAA domain
MNLFAGEREAAAPGLLDGMVDGAWLDAQVFPPLEWSVDGIVPEGFGLLVAPPKAGKSWMVAGIGLACAAGGYALGKIAVDQRPVLYLALEDGHRRLQSRFRTLMEGQPIPKRMEVITKAQAFEVPAMIEEWLGRHPGEKPLIILDTLGKVKPPKRAGEDSYAADYAIGGRLKDLIDAVPGATLLVVHHTRKAESDDFVDAVSGTQGIAGSADFILVLRRKRQSAEAVLSVTGRDVPENEYALTTEGGLWMLDGADLTAAAESVKTRKNTENLGDRSVDVLAYVTKNPEGVTPAQTDAALGITDSKVYLARLYNKGSLDRPVRGIYTTVTSPSAVTSVTSVTNARVDGAQVTQVTEVTPPEEVTAPLWDER